MAFSVTVGSGVLVAMVLHIFPEFFIGFFANAEESLINATKVGIRLHLMALFLDGFIFMASIYFVAVGKSGQALFVSVGNMIVQLPFLLILPHFWGIEGVWLVVPLSSIAFTAIVLPMLLTNLKGLKAQHRNENGNDMTLSNHLS